MPSGGARTRSGPQPTEASARSDRRGYSLQALPSAGYRGRVPKWPLPDRVVYRWESEEGRRFQVCNDDATELVAEREKTLWHWAWRTPQACAWSMPSEAWRLYTIALYVRTFVLCESSEATAADKASLHRFADQIGMTTAGLAQMGWKIAVDELAKKAAERPAAEPARPLTARERLAAASGGGG